jgi:hypothetical protein
MTEALRPRRISCEREPDSVDLGQVGANLVGAPGQDPRGQIRPVIGGTQLTGGLGVGTLGLVVVDPEDVSHLLTAGHVCGEPDTLVEQPGAGAVVGRVQLNGFSDGRGVDIAVTTVAAGVQVTNYEIFGTLVNYRVTRMQAWPEVGQQVTMQGAASGATNGLVKDPNATITFGSTQLKNVSVATYGSAAGDSGAPVVNIDGDTVTCLGIHGGSFVQSGTTLAWFTPVATIDTIFVL